MPRKKANSGSMSSRKVENCPGYTDEFGIWNNGFLCPKWGAADRKYCCGSANKRFCCDPPTTTVSAATVAPTERDVLPAADAEHLPPTPSLPVMVGSAAAGTLLLALVATVFCYFCRCCWAYKRRKRALRSDDPVGMETIVRNAHATASFSNSGNGYQYQAFLQESRYPLDDPPPYPGEPEKRASLGQYSTVRSNTSRVLTTFRTPSSPIPVATPVLPGSTQLPGTSFRHSLSRLDQSPPLPPRPILSRPSVSASTCSITAELEEALRMCQVASPRLETPPPLPPPSFLSLPRLPDVTIHSSAMAVCPLAESCQGHLRPGSRCSSVTSGHRVSGGKVA